jgi:FKBP-type peptidyl-prolyl cis-trans isomerase FklB
MEVAVITGAVGFKLYSYLLFYVCRFSSNVVSLPDKTGTFMKKSILFFSLVTLHTCIWAQVKKPAAPTVKPKPVAAPVAGLKTMSDSVSYSVGVKIAQSLKTQGFDDLNFEMIRKAFNDVKNGAKPFLSEEVINKCLGQFQEQKNAERVMANKKESIAFLAANGKRQGVVTLPSGLQYEIMRAGNDTVKPTIDSKVRCHYHGTLIDGRIFDSSVDRGAPITFPLRNVIRGWQEGLPLMTVGSKWKFFVPSDLGYGDAGTGGMIGPGAALIFEVELLGIEN